MNKDLILKFIKEKRLIENLILFASITTVNFSSYLLYYDFNSVLIIDTTTVARHIFGMVILFVIISAITAVFLLVLQNIVLTGGRLLGTDTFSFYIPKKSRINAYSVLDKKLLRYSISILIFFFIYIGIYNTMLLSFLIFIYLSAILFLQKNNIESEPLETPVNSKIKLPKIKKHLVVKHASPFFVTTFSELFSLYARVFGFISIHNLKDFFWVEKGNYRKLITSKIGIFIILVSIVLGSYRANYVEDNVHIVLNGNRDIEYALFMSSSNGVALYDRETKVVKFTPWEKIESLEFIAKKRKSYYSLFSH